MLADVEAIFEGIRELAHGEDFADDAGVVADHVGGEKVRLSFEYLESVGKHQSDESLAVDDLDLPQVGDQESAPHEADAFTHLDDVAAAGILEDGAIVSDAKASKDLELELAGHKSREYIVLGAVANFVARHLKNEPRGGAERLVHAVEREVVLRRACRLKESLSHRCALS